MRYAKLFSLTVFAVMAVYAVAGFYYLPLAHFDGDLTRIGKLPESEFGWRAPQPAIAPGLMRQSAWQDADVLVIGDSFSDTRVWQTELVRRGLNVRTEDWTGMRNICEDFSSSLREKGYKGRYVIFEVVERNLENLLSQSLACRKMEYHSNVKVEKPRPVPPVTIDRSRDEYSGRLSVGIDVRLNMFKNAWRGEAPHGISVERVKDGCALFSHPRCDTALFLDWDRAGDFGEGTLADMGKLSARAAGYSVLWAVVPDKSTVYLHPEKQFWDKAEARHVGANLLGAFARAVDARVVDLYPANNTHLSTRGYQIMGDTVYQSLLGRGSR